MGKIITFAQQKGGSGKTTALAHLAVAFTKSGRSVALIDLDPQGSLTRWARLRSDPNILVVVSKDYRAGADMKAAAKTHDFVLVDCPGASTSLLDAALRESDLVVAPCQPSAVDAWALGSVLDAAAGQKTPVRILFNRVPSRTVISDEMFGTLDPAKVRILEARLGNRVVFAQSMQSGQTALDVSSRSAAATETEAVRHEIESTLGA